MNEKVNVEFIVALRAKKAWTQEELALAAGVSLRTVQRMEKSGRCSIAVKKAIASAFEVEASELSPKAQSSAVESEHAERFLVRVEDGRRLAQVIGGAHGYRVSHDQPRTEDEVDLLAAVAQSIQDWGEIWPDLEPGERVKATFELNNSIKELEAAGFWVFAAHTVEPIPGVKDSKWNIANVQVLRASNPLIVTVTG